MKISLRGQRVLLWWAWISMLIFGFSMWLLCGMVPPPAADWPAEQVAAFYAENATQIRIGAMITSWTSAFMVPWTAVVTMQLLRIETGRRPVWTVVQFASGIMMSIFLVLPPLFWGVAAFNPGRLPDVTALMHELSLLTLTTTDQYYIWQMVAITYLSFVAKPDPLSPFPRWIGYLTIWAAIMFEVGALAFNFKTGVFSWAGLFVFWFPFCIFGLWNTTLTFSMLGAIRRQEAAGEEE